MTHSQQSEELLDVYSCGLDRTPREPGLVSHMDWGAAAH